MKVAVDKRGREIGGQVASETPSAIRIRHIRQKADTVSVASVSLTVKE